MEETNGSFVIADIFDKREVEKIEAQFKEYFSVQKKEIITHNVKHAMQLDKPRIEKLISSITENKVI
jgi:hypothetical protein